MPGPTSKHTLFNPATLNQVTCSIPALARASFDYLFNTYPVDLKRGCNQFGECGFSKTDCPCLEKFASKIRLGDAPNVPWDDVTSWNHYKAVFLLFARIWRAMATAPESEETLAQVMDWITLTVRRSKRNQTPDIFVKTPIGSMIFCFNGFVEMGGHQLKPHFRKFYRKLFTGSFIL